MRLFGRHCPASTLRPAFNHPTLIFAHTTPHHGHCPVQALRAAAKGVNCNVVVPGVTETGAWGKLAATRGADRDEMVKGIASRICPMGVTMVRLKYSVVPPMTNHST